MYDMVQSRRRSKRRPLLGIILVLVILFLVVVLLFPASWGVLYQIRFWNYMSDLSDSTSYAYDHGCLMAEYDGKAVRVKGNQIYLPYRLASLAGRGRPSSPPKTPPDLLLNYNDSSYLSLWAAKVDGSLRSSGVIVSYVNQKGRSITCDTDLLNLDNIFISLGLPLPGKNQQTTKSSPVPPGSFHHKNLLCIVWSAKEVFLYANAVFSGCKFSQRILFPVSRTDFPSKS